MAISFSEILTSPGVSGPWLAQALSSTSSTLLATILTLLAVPLATWCLSLFLSRPAEPGSGREPPVAPYAIPYLQHLPSFLWSPGGLLKNLKKKYGSTPFSIMMMNTKFHVFGSLPTAKTVFSRSRDFVFEPVLASMMGNGMGLPEQDLRWFDVPIEKRHTKSSGREGTAPQVSEPDPRAFADAHHRLWMTYLSGKWLDGTMDVFLSNLVKSMDRVLDVPQSDCTNGWGTVDLREALPQIIFETSAMTFFGPRLASFWQDMWSDYRTFDDATYIGVRSGLIYSLRPRAGKARERMLSAFERWADCELEEWKDADGAWDEQWGVRLNREREKLARKFDFSPRGRACLHASFLFAIITNAAPMGTWVVASIISSPSRLARFRKEAHSYLLPPDPSLRADEVRFDLDALQKNPYIHGVWNETVRLGSQSAAARVVTCDTELEGYILRRGSVILLPVQLLHFNEDIFPEPDEFRPERWMDPSESGEQVDEEQEPSASRADEDRAKKAKKAFQEQLKEQRASLRTFGGGTSLCSGRFFAEKEILSTVSAMVTLFDLEPQVVGAVRNTNGAQKGNRAEAKCDVKIELDPRSLGIMKPAGKVLVRIRRRGNPRTLGLNRRV